MRVASTAPEPIVHVRSIAGRRCSARGPATIIPPDVARGAGGGGDGRDAGHRPRDRRGVPRRRRAPSVVCARPTARRRRGARRADGPLRRGRRARPARLRRGARRGRRPGRRRRARRQRGGTPAADPLTASPRFHAAVVELNLTAPMQCAFAAHARARAPVAPTGSILFISSVAAHGARPGGARRTPRPRPGSTHLTMALARRSPRTCGSTR